MATRTMALILNALQNCPEAENFISAIHEITRDSGPHAHPDTRTLDELLTNQDSIFRRIQPRLNRISPPQGGPRLTRDTSRVLTNELRRLREDFWREFEQRFGGRLARTNTISRAIASCTRIPNLNTPHELTEEQIAAIRRLQETAANVQTILRDAFAMAESINSDAASIAAPQTT